MGQTQVHVVRHGEVHNPEGVLYGRLAGFHLTDLGLEMAARTAKFLSGRQNVTHLRCSPLERAQETMGKVSEYYPDLDVVLDNDLIEADSALVGQVFGPKNKALKNPKNWVLYRNPLRPSWGEPYADIAVRMRRAITAAALAASQARPDTDSEAIVVSHQLPIWVARLSFEQTRLWHDPRSRQCTLASVTTFHFDNGVFTHTSYAEPAIDLVPRKDRKAVFSSGRGRTAS